MNYKVQNYLKSDEKYLRYLRENSYWYKELNRNPELVTKMIDEMKEKYKLRPTDKINNIIDTMEVVSAFVNETDK